ncbi:MAG: hypothetical protein LQ340_006179 [Diploschistes diacapsis]|nr:MAG: hypothetical protein LQ340_006179 [Diploschistes diacapsis]
MTGARYGLVHSSALILLSLCVLPISTYVLLCAYTLQALLVSASKTQSRRKTPNFQPRRVLISGINTTNGLALARSFHKAGHHVTGVDCHISPLPGIGRVSRAVKKYYSLSIPRDELAATDYVHALLQVVQEERADLWVSCSAFTTSVEDSLAKEVIERKTKCRCLGLDLATTSLLSNQSDFLQHARSMGLPSRESYNVTSRNEVHHVIGAAAPSSRSFTISKVRSRQNKEDKLAPPRNISPLLPRRSVSETYQVVSEIAISPEAPYVLEEDVGGEEYTTYCLVIRGSVKAFAACPVPGRSMQIQALPASSGLHQAMLKFAQEFTSRFEHELTGNLSFTFRVQESATADGYHSKLIPVACEPKAEMPSILLHYTKGDLPGTILAILRKSASNGYVKPSTTIITVEQPLSCYWTGHDLVSMVVLPSLRFLSLQAGLSELLRGWFLFTRNLLFSKDITFELWDPFPWWWQYHVYWPVQLLLRVLHRRKWSHIDLDSGRMYE